MKYYIPLLTCIVLLSQCRPKADTTKTDFPGKPNVPESVMQEHKYLLGQVKQYASYTDSTGSKAKQLFDLMEHHFREEEDYVLPALGLLPMLSGGQLPDSGSAVIALTEKFKTQYDHMGAEHQLISAFMDELVIASQIDGHPEVQELEKRLQRHAKMEEEILFPAALLVGEYIRLRTAGIDTDK